MSMGELVNFTPASGNFTPLNEPALKGGGGDGTSSDMEARVASLENDMRSIRETLVRIEGKLDTKASSVELAELKGKLETKASAADMNNLAGKVSNLPTTLQLLGFAVAIFVASGLVKHFFP